MAGFKEEVRNILAEAKKKGLDNLSQEGLLAILVRIDALLNKMLTFSRLERSTSAFRVIVPFDLAPVFSFM